MTIPSGIRAPPQPDLGVIRRVIILGPVASPGKPAVGGFQISNLRLAALLQGFVPRVDFLRYPESGGPILRKLGAYTAAFARIAAMLVIGSSRGCVVHYTPYVGYFLPAEFGIALLARLRGYRLIIDLRAGGKDWQFRTYGPLYRLAFARFFRLAHAVAFEGQGYAQMLRAIAPRKPLFHLPNFVPGSIIKARGAATGEGPRLVYVGRISEAKGAAAALDAFAALRARLPSAGLTFVGSADPEFERRLRGADPRNSGIRWTGPLPLDRVLNELDVNHFFLFLSKWWGEGHSNALTEAMARGCVPVCTRHGFNETVVGHAGLIVDDRADAAAIAEGIVAVWMQHQWPDLSRRSVERVAANFTDTVILSTLRRLYCDVLPV